MANKSQSPVTGLNYHLLLQLADDGNSHTQDQWTKYAQKNNIGIASFSDIYNKVAKTKDKTLINFLRQAFRGWVITSDRFNYQPNELNTTLTSHIENTIIPSTQTDLILPYWSKGEYLSDILKSSDEGISAVRKLLKTSDNKDELEYNLEVLTGMSSKQTRFWTPSQEYRKSNPVRDLKISYCGSIEFLVDGSGLLDDSGGAVPVSKD